MHIFVDQIVGLPITRRRNVHCFIYIPEMDYVEHILTQAVFI